MYICPNCGLKLNKDGNKYICQKNHSFDIARQGYVNLLPVFGKKSKDPGDNEIMTVARREFLSSGHYGKLLDRLSELIKNQNKKVLVDAGCSEGYYTSKFSENIEKVYAFDISKTAIKTASASDKKTNYFVASSFNIPFPKNSVDIITKIFAPDSPSEFFRILKKDGILIEVIPGENHLLELKERLYDKVYLNKIESGEKKGFNLEKEEKLIYKFKPNEKERLNLFKMTPYYYKTDPERQKNIINAEEFEITGEFIIRIFKKFEK